MISKSSAVKLDPASATEIMITKKQIAFGVIAGIGIGAMYYYNRKKKNIVTGTNALVSKNINDKFGKANDKFLNNLNPAGKQIFRNFINDIISKGYGVVISSGYRPTSEQVALKKINSKNATPGYSTHEYGIGIDISLVKDGKWINKSSPLASWNATGIPQLAKTKYNMRWGGDFKGYLDPVHFDLGNSYDVKKLYTKALLVYGSASKIRGNEMKLV